MAFELIPAVDVFGGRLARYTPSGPQAETAAEGEPLRAARAFVDAGARWVHVVDMDLAFRGVQANLDLLGAIAGLGASVQAAGGIAGSPESDAALRAGASRVVLGSGALLDRPGAAAEIARLGDRAVVGIEVEDGRVRARGLRPTDLPLDETLGWVAAAGAGRLLVTGTSRVGTLAGPDLVAVAVAVATGIPVIAAGGIGKMDDLAALREAGAVGAVVGRAALDGTIDLAAAIASFG